MIKIYNKIRDSQFVMHIGHRGAFLIFVGLAFIFYGLGLFFNTPAFERHIDLLLTWHTWASLWVFTGVVAIAGAFNGRDRMSFGFATFISAWWAARWFHVWIFEKGAFNVWPTVLTWVAISGIFFILSSWQEDRRNLRKRKPPKVE
jgi:hypothetical protein